MLHHSPCSCSVKLLCFHKQYSVFMSSWGMRSWTYKSIFDLWKKQRLWKLLFYVQLWIPVHRQDVDMWCCYQGNWECDRFIYAITPMNTLPDTVSSTSRKEGLVFYNLEHRLCSVGLGRKYDYVCHIFVHSVIVLYVKLLLIWQPGINFPLSMDNCKILGKFNSGKNIKD